MNRGKVVARSGTPPVSNGEKPFEKGSIASQGQPQIFSRGPIRLIELTFEGRALFGETLCQTAAQRRRFGGRRMVANELDAAAPSLARVDGVGSAGVRQHVGPQSAGPSALDDFFYRSRSSSWSRCSQCGFHFLPVYS
jgi:hypothetical protein